MARVASDYYKNLKKTLTDPNRYREMGRVASETVGSGLGFASNVLGIPTTQQVVSGSKQIYDFLKPEQNFSDAAMNAIRARAGGGVSIGNKQIFPNKNTTTSTTLPSQTQEAIDKAKKNKSNTTGRLQDLVPFYGGLTDKKTGTTTGEQVNKEQVAGKEIPGTQKDGQQVTEEPTGVIAEEIKTPTQPTLDELRQKAFQEQQAFIESGLQGQLTGLEASKQRSLGTLEQQRGQISPQYEALRTQAANRAMQQARNFAEYMGARGALMGGAATQAEIQRGAELQGAFGQIGLAEQQAIQDLENKKSDVTLQYDTEISQAKTKAEQTKKEIELKKSLEEITRIEKEMIDKINNERQVEQEKIKQAAQTAKDETDFQRKKELIAFETNESIRAAREKAKFELTSEDKRKYSETPEYQNAINSVRKGILPSRTSSEGIKLSNEQIINGEYVNYLLNNYQEIIDDLTVNGYEALLKEAIKYSKQNINIEPIMAEILGLINQ